MSTLNGNNYDLEASSPQVKIPKGSVFGKVHNLRESYTIAAALSVSDEILGPILPKGAIVLDAKLHVDATLGTGGILDLGYSASDDGVESEDTDAFVSQADAGGAAVLSRMGASAAGIYKEFSAPVRTKATVTEASSVTSGVTISWDITYVLN
jgi:hypothetical protein